MKHSITNESKYTCDHNPAVKNTKDYEMICSGCMVAIVNRHNKMFEFVNEIASNQHQDNIYYYDAKTLLEEIG